MPFLRFSLERRATGDFKNIAIPDASKLIGKEWHALTESEKQVRIHIDLLTMNPTHTLQPYKDAYLAEKGSLA